MTAVGELNVIEPSELRAWRRSRLGALSAGALCQVGYADILVKLPPFQQLGLSTPLA
jgi:hypothetical protein